MFHSAVLRACSLDWCRLSVGKMDRASYIHAKLIHTDTDNSLSGMYSF